MPITIRKDVIYTILKKISEGGQEMHEVKLDNSDLTGLGVSEADLLGHLDYLNQNHFIKAEFTGNAYAEPEKLPEEILHPEPIKFKAAEIGDKGRKLLSRIEAELEKASGEPTPPINAKDMPFLEKVMLKGGIEDIFDARDITEVVFRVMRDLMTTEAADRVESELHKEALPATEDKSLQMEIADLWHDTNPIVGLLSRVRPPWQGPGIFKIDSDRFLFRVANESGFSHEVDREQVVKAVFSATKDELSQERVQEIASWLPDYVRKLWEEA
ncbi:MAG: DUF2267 domain-containing protein [Calothrix sp. C42_A2020_038]|nr:DUF2267 domain-containing protein [Calothrix sp. C42_A2020_038]